MTDTTRYPLTWPVGWVRTGAARRKRATFSSHPRGQFARPLTIAQAIDRLQGELDRLGATGEVLSTNVQTRLDGLPRSDQANPDDPGAAVYFRLKGQSRVLACDRWDRVADNIAAIAQHIDALRRIDRYGVGTMEQAFAGYAALPPAAESWWLVLGVPHDAPLSVAESAFRDLAKRHHPDLGGDHATMAKITEAMAIARAEIADDRAEP